MKELNYAYLAGLIDGDGTITIRHISKDKYCPYISIANTNKDVLVWCKSKVGSGTICTKKAKKKNHLESYTINWSYDIALDIASRCSPYLIIKKEQAVALLEWKLCTPRNGYYTKELKTKKEELILKIKILNARGRWKDQKILYQKQLDTIKSINLEAQRGL